jgi:hypothetical protein
MPGYPGVPEDIVEHVELPGRMLEGVALGVGIVGTPLTPAFPISVEPSGIPGRLAPPGAIVAADDAFAALPPALAEPPAQGEAPLPGVVPYAALIPVAMPMPVPPPSNVAVDVPDIPEGALPAAEHGTVPPTPNGAGLTPAVPSSVAPNGMPTGPTGRLPCTPSGEVGSMPGEETEGAWANAALPLRRAASIVTSNKRFMNSPQSTPKELAACRAGHQNFDWRRARWAMRHFLQIMLHARNTLVQNCGD